LAINPSKWFADNVYMAHGDYGRNRSTLRVW
jgi:hypothetical protein